MQGGNGKIFFDLAIRFLMALFKLPPALASGQNRLLAFQPLAKASGKFIAQLFSSGASNPSKPERCISLSDK
jgi:hypothetical protein